MSASISQAPGATTQAAVAALGRAQSTAPITRLKDDKPAGSETTVNLGQSVRPDLQLYSEAAVKATAKAASIDASAGPTVSAGSVVAGKGAITVDVLASDSGYENKIYYSTDNFKTKHYIGTDNHLASVDIGKFAEGTKIDFGIDNGVGGFYRTGGAAANPDNFDHTQVVKTANAVNVNFEDFKNGGDRDFNDALIRVRATAPEASNEKPAAAKDNRSGLGDGTNPGAGAGTSNASNVGTANPGGVKAASAPAPAPVIAHAPAPSAVPAPPVSAAPVASTAPAPGPKSSENAGTSEKKPAGSASDSKAAQPSGSATSASKASVVSERDKQAAVSVINVPVPLPAAKPVPASPPKANDAVSAAPPRTSAGKENPSANLSSVSKSATSETAKAVAVPVAQVEKSVPPGKPAVAPVSPQPVRTDGASGKPAAPASQPAPVAAGKATVVTENSAKPPVAAAPKASAAPAAAGASPKPAISGGNATNNPAKSATDANQTNQTNQANHTNRSGLGDGTNPGQGAGTVRSPNQGVNNPGNAVASVLK